MVSKHGMNFPELFFAHQPAFFGTFRLLLIGLHSSGNFEDFKALGALLELSIGGCKIDCKNALEALPTMPWAGQIQKLDLSNTDAEGTENIRYFAHQSALFGMFLTIHLPQCYALSHSLHHEHTTYEQATSRCSRAART